MSGQGGAASLWIPDGFDPARYLGDALRKRGDLACFIVDRIFGAVAMNREPDGGFIPLKATYLRRFFPDGAVYVQVKDRLIEGGALECDRRYVVGEKCLGYRLADEFAGMRPRRIRVADARLAEKIALWHAKRHESLMPLQRRMDSDLKTTFIESGDATNMLDQGEITGWARTVAELSVLKIAHGDFFFHPDPYGRCHTNITNLRSELRRCLRVRGEPLVMLDIRNSQPLIFAAVLRDRYRAAPGPRGTPGDVGRYIELVEAGQFYDHLMREWGEPAGRRDGFKKGFFSSVLYCENDPMLPMAYRFRDAFPSVYAAIRAMKTPAYEALAHKMQRRESAIMLDGVVGRCHAEIPHAYVATVHDAIMCHARHKEAIRRFMIEEFGKAGLRPTIH